MRLAETRSKARYLYWREASDVWPDIRLMDISVRATELDPVYEVPVLDKPLPAKPDRPRKTWKYSEWIEEAKRLYGPKSANWRFKCVRCGHVQTAKDFVDAGLTKDQAVSRVYFSCIGRVKNGVGCDWTLGGLFQLHTDEVVAEDGEIIPVFEFADTEPVIESVPVLKDEDVPGNG